MKYSRSSRTAKGQVLIEGAIGLILVIGGCMLAVVLVLNSSVGACYKSRLAVVTNMATQFAVTKSTDAGLSAETNTFVQQLMSQAGMAPYNLTVTVKLATIDTQPGVLVSISNQFPVLGNGTLIPMQLKVADTEFGAILPPPGNTE
jgi:hypothetical protein